MERSDQGLYLRYLLKDQHTTGPPTPDTAVCCRLGAHDGAVELREPPAFRRLHVPFALWQL